MKIGDKTLSEWKEFARRDDCLERMVPSDLRLVLMAIEVEREACASLADHYGHHFAGLHLSEKSQVCWAIREAIRDRANHTVLTSSE